MLNVFRRSCALINVAYTYAAVLLLAAIIAASSMQVFTRYALNASMVGTEEFARFCFIWMSMLGGSVCVARGAHPAVAILSDFLGSVPRRALSIVIHILIILCSAIFLYYGYKMVRVTGNQFSPTLRIRMHLIYFSLPAGGFGMMLNAFARIVEDIRVIMTGEANA